jgi:formylglycine-generating enzyme
VEAVVTNKPHRIRILELLSRDVWLATSTFTEIYTIMKVRSLLTFAVTATLITSATATVTIDYVSVGHAGNAADTTGYGAVAYAYQISKYEVTISQYAEFLNAAAKSDTYGLWNSNMGSDTNISGITRSGDSGSYSYSVTGSGLRPITYVGWYDAARFTNWLNNGQGDGSTEIGAYTLSGNTGMITKSISAAVWLPSENEWYKAAYYDPTKDGVAGYWSQANQNNFLGSNRVDSGSANYYEGASSIGEIGGWHAVTQSGYSPSDNYLTDVGAYGPNSVSYFGTYDQAGNVREWNDAVIDYSVRGVRGGSWIDPLGNLAASNRTFGSPMDESSFVGFRVASSSLSAVPEPTALLSMAGLLGSGFLLRRRTKNSLLTARNLLLAGGY